MVGSAWRVVRRALETDQRRALESGWWVVRGACCDVRCQRISAVRWTLDGGWCVARVATCAGNGAETRAGVWMVGGAWRVLRGALETDQRRALE